MDGKDLRSLSKHQLRFDLVVGLANNAASAYLLLFTDAALHDALQQLARGAKVLTLAEYLSIPKDPPWMDYGAGESVAYSALVKDTPYMCVNRKSTLFESWYIASKRLELSNAAYRPLEQEHDERPVTTTASRIHYSRQGKLSPMYSR